jgi:four helix bundle protein
VGYVLEPRTRAFAFAVLRFIGTLPNTAAGRIVAWQLGKAGSSVGANYRRAKRAQSNRDFVAKMKIVEEEADECAFWLEGCLEIGIGDQASARRLHSECGEVTAMTVAAIKTMKARLASGRS